MIDYINLIKFIRTEYPMIDQTVVFGGSYGGMLAAWMRMKYPNVVDVAVASSAPVLMFKDSESYHVDDFADFITDIYSSTYEDERCSIWIHKALECFEEGVT